MIIRWISDVPSKMVKILEVIGRVICTPTTTPIAPVRMGYHGAARGFPTAQGHYPLRSLPALAGRRYPGDMTMSPEHVDLHRLVDRLDPD